MQECIWLRHLLSDFFLHKSMLLLSLKTTKEQYSLQIMQSTTNVLNILRYMICFAVSVSLQEMLIFNIAEHEIC